jgi:D-lyxose ketol-isomerase
MENSDFYRDGVFQAEKAKELYYEMFERFHYPICPAIKSDQFWTLDFGLGDFLNVGMAGIFWCNDQEYGYFGHDIFLLPGQMIPEHAHVKTAKGPAKMETWHIRYGSLYVFGEGEETDPCPVDLPASQNEEFVTSRDCEKLEVGDVRYLKRPTAPHFVIASSEGAIMAEYGTFHDDEGLRWTNPNVSFSSD